MSVDEFAGDAPEPVWSVGELAAATGLTVPTLQHYDEIGLLRPSLRSHGGHRRYTSADVLRLHRVTALRGFGFALSRIAGLLDDAVPGRIAGLDARELVLRQLDQVQDRILHAHRLRDRLLDVLRLLDDGDDPPASMLVPLVAELTAVQHAYTAEEIEHLAGRRRAAGT